MTAQQAARYRGKTPLLPGGFFVPFYMILQSKGSEIDAMTNRIKENIDYDILCERYSGDMLDELLRIYNELNHIGNNINQIAHVPNAERHISDGRIDSAVNLMNDVLWITQRRSLNGHTVTETRVDGHLQMIQKDLTKNNSSFRSLPLVAPIKELLNEKRKNIYECKKLFKSGYCSKYSDYVCVNEIGELIRPRTLSDNFKRIIKKNNIRNLRLYDCRHTAASIMLKNGVSMKQIQMILGHSDYATTANIYSHLDYADKVSATKEMKSILYGNE